MGYILELCNISKSFPGVKALDNARLTISAGEIHAVMGENGAGKSTLMKIATGIYQPDCGEIYVAGQKVSFNTSRDSLKAGISMIHQELMPVLDMTVEENIYLGRYPKHKGNIFIDRKELHKKAETILSQVGLSISPTTKMRTLSTAKLQLVEIAKAVSFQSDVLIMDEPTSSLAENEIEKLYNVMRQLKEKGVAIVFITHKLDEVFKITDRVTVYRDGKYIATTPTDQLSRVMLVEQMVGRKIDPESRRFEHHVSNEVVLEVENLCVPKVLHNISFSVHAGEILGISGLMGAGRTETAEVIFGLRKASKGSIFVHGKRVNIQHPAQAIRSNIALLTEDRKRSGLNLIATVKENITLVSLKRFTKASWIDRKEEARAAEEYCKLLSIKTPSISQRVKNLSGGNQQKVVLAKWLLEKSDIIIMDEPTRGIDVAAKEEIYTLIKKMALDGKTIILISSEMEEIISLSDRIVVFNSGRITGELLKKDITQENILVLAAKSIKESEVVANG